MHTSESAGIVLDREARLRAAFSSVPIEESAMRDAVCAFVDVTKGHGWSVERVLIDLKRIAEIESGSLHEALRDPHRRAEAQAVINRAVSVCIQHYYGSVG